VSSYALDGKAGSTAGYNDGLPECPPSTGVSGGNNPFEVIPINPTDLPPPNGGWYNWGGTSNPGNPQTPVSSSPECGYFSAIYGSDGTIIGMANGCQTIYFTNKTGSDGEMTGTLLPECNGDGSGVVIVPSTGNPCEIAAIPVSNANDILHEPTISTQVSTLENHAANSFTEYGMAIINTGTTTIAQDPYTNNDPSNPGTVSITIPPVGSYLASAHSHPSHSASPPSVADFYVDLKDVKNYPSFQAGFVFANNGTKYAFVVNDRAKAEAFLAAYPFLSNTTADGRMFNENSQVGKDFINILKDYMQGRLPSYSGNSQNDGLESAYAEILQKYDTGISLTKTDANGNLKSLRSVSFKHTVSASGGKKIIGYKAEKCP